MHFTLRRPRRLAMPAIITMILVSMFAPIARGTAQEAAARPTLRAGIAGLVVDENERPIPNVLVSLPSLRRTTTTNDSGRFLVRDLPPTAHVLEVRRLGYQSAVRSVALDVGEQVNLTLRLSRSPISVPEVVVTGRAGASDRRGAQDVVALGTARLRESGSGSIGKTLERVPGVSNMSGGPGGGNPVLRGLSQGRVRIVRDGVPQESFEASPRWFPAGNISSADRIEVIRGPASILYGSNALGGAINIVPRELPLAGDDGPQLRGLAESQYFSNNDERYGHGELAGARGGVGLRFGAAHRVAGNFHTPDVIPYAVSRIRGAPKITGEVFYTNFEQTSRYAQAGITERWGSLRALYDGWDGASNFANANGKPAGVRSHSDDLRLQGVIVRGGAIIKPTIARQRVGILRAATVAKTFDVAADSNLWDQDLFNRVLTLRLEVEHPAVAGFHGTLGGEYAGQRAETRRSQIQPSGEISNAAAFALEEYRVDNLTLSAGGRLDARHQVAESGTLVSARPPSEQSAALDRRTEVVTGSIGAAYQGSTPLSVTANASSGFRAPSFLDLYTNENRPALGGWIEGNPDAQPERSTSVEAGLHYQTARLTWGVTAYSNTFQAFTYLNRTPRTHVVNGSPVPVFATQQTAARLAGVELDGIAEVLPSLVLDASYSTITSRNSSTGETLPLMPADQARASLRYSPDAFLLFRYPYAQISAKHAWAKQIAGLTEPFADGGAEGYGVGSTPAYTVFDIGTGGHVVVAASELEVHLAIENVLDTAFRDFLDTQKGFTLGAGRNFTVRVSVPFILRR